MTTPLTQDAPIMRDSNMELLRIISMLLVLGLHVNYVAIGTPTADDLQHSAFTSYTRIFLQQFCIVCVNIFVLISGWYGIKPSMKGVLKLIFQVFTIESVMLIVARFLGAEITVKSIIKLFVIGSSYWFIPAYLILYCIAPIINAFFDNSTKKEAGYLLLAFFSLQFVYGYLFSDLASFGYGCSALSFIGLYSLARYARNHSARLFQLPIWKDIVIILSMTLIGTIIAIALLKKGIHRIPPQACFNNPLVIIASLYWVLLFSKLPFKNRFVNWMGKSSFAIYLTHCQPLIFALLTTHLANCFTNNAPIIYLGIAILFIIGIFISSILLDQFRIFVWNALQIKDR